MKSSTIFVAIVTVTNVNALSFTDIGNTLSSYTSSSADVFRRARDALPSLIERKDGGSGSGSGNPGSCPVIWKTVVSDLTAMFLDKSTGQCNDAARAAIRVSYLFLILPRNH
jgi:hypothetical protein